MLHKTLQDLQRGINYEIRVSGRNNLDYGEETVDFYTTPEAPPSGPPQNISYRYIILIFFLFYVYSYTHLKLMICSIIIIPLR